MNLHLGSLTIGACLGSGLASATLVGCMMAKSADDATIRSAGGDSRILLGVHEKVHDKKRAATIELGDTSAWIRMGPYTWSYRGSETDRYVINWFDDMFTRKALYMALLDDKDKDPIRCRVWMYEKEVQRFLTQLRARDHCRPSSAS